MINSSVCYFTCLTSGYDSILHFEKTIDYGKTINIITNCEDVSHNFISKNVVFHFVENKFESNIIYNRWHKFWPFDVLPSYQYYVYIDSNIILDYNKLEHFLKNFEITEFNSFYHPSGRTLFEEAIYNLSISKINHRTFSLFKEDKIINNYFDFHISENCFLIYTKNYINRELAIDLLNLIRKFKRDQLILVPFLKQNNINYTFFEADKRNFLGKLEHSNTNSLPLGFQFFYPFYSFLKYNFLKWKLR